MRGIGFVFTVRVLLIRANKEISQGIAYPFIHVPFKDLEVLKKSCFRHFVKDVSCPVFDVHCFFVTAIASLRPRLHALHDGSEIRLP